MTKIKIENKLIGKGSSCFIIAEAGVNHNGNVNLAKKLIDKAKEAGADAVKFQTFKTEKIVTKDARQARYQAKNIGKKESQYEILRKLELSYSDFTDLKKYCDKKKIIFLSTAHSCKEDVDLVAKLCPAIKIASGDLINLPFLKYAAKKNLPIILSTGMATLKEVKEAVKTVLPFNKKLILLHCTTNYPTPLNDVNLRAMIAMKKAFNLPIGYSDHTKGIKVALAAVAFGAKVIEKHFTLDKKMLGPDHKASIEPKELKEMVLGIRKIENKLKHKIKKDILLKELDINEILGDGIKKPTLSEIEIAKIVRKSIVAAKNIRKGVEIKEDMLVIKRPGIGILPKHFNWIIGKKVKEKIEKDELISLGKLI